MAYTKNDLRLIFQHLSSLLPPGAKPLTTEQVVEVGDLLAKTKTEIATSLGAIERGAKVFEWRVPTELAPTMNSWGFMKTWQRARTRRELEASLHAAIAAVPNAKVPGAERMRWVRVTRFTPNAKLVDEAAVDSIGGKMPIDVLVSSGVVAGDSPKYLRREARCEVTKRGNTHVLVEVFDVAHDEVATPLATDAQVEQVERTFGTMTQEVLGKGTGPKNPPRVLPFGEEP